MGAVSDLLLLSGSDHCAEVVSGAHIHLQHPPLQLYSTYNNNNDNDTTHPPTSQARDTMAITDDPSELEFADLQELLKHDISIKVAGVDIDGQLRGKLMSKKKFFSIVKSGFGFCSVIFGWDMHDQTYFKELKVSNAENGYRDITAEIDLSSFRRIPWENNIPFFLVSFREPEGASLSACPRSLLERTVDKIEAKGMGALAGAEYEFFTFRAPTDTHISPTSDNRNSSATATFLQKHPVNHLPSLEEGMFGYSLTRPVHNQEWYYGIFDACSKFRCDIEGWHTESGPGVYEAALEYGEIRQMADRAALFKLTVKSVSSNYGITPCFMAKPREGLPGNSGHMHISLKDNKTGRNLFAREKADPNPPFEGLEDVSDIGRQFLAGVLDGLADIMPLFAPTVNSYKRLVENFWAPVTVSWGLEHRAASIRLIAPPTSPPKGTRLEIRVAGADTNGYLVLAGILALGYRGIEKKMSIPIPPLGKGEDVGGSGDKGQRLAKSLKEATAQFARKESVAREVLGDDFVDHYAGTREHEVRLWDEAVTDWEVRRYIETV
ncbi:Type-1 glutamine synthetase 2 [Fulvia fulva]|uniref:Glutamine synthetase n=1 Tax=Passalora fulva TaxID=5499 RepID=A0A9Q8L638_PASFU|nr:Type-1 glutamine synthetase 2 [Fulvia fulva]KAK4634320.1 Type-1 glutamine synthetase 2 [Fulvia fulva]KAK4638668.1 Type-1 glutamine synthetase 2 [Fulvia fulva]UJO11424.1 Type-1 glutamine synthetase 2 [Fulvia fulva]WPV08681.1 Type-1 glutamine synthetase 2 [Fulvia fulva]WPV23631.1 Type-1 glutamine synthetase 2 [Fulvia fulva]